MLERVVERSRMACLPRLLRMERLARDRSAVMWVMEILGAEGRRWGPGTPLVFGEVVPVVGNLTCRQICA